LSWKDRLVALAGDLRDQPRVEVRAFHLFPPSEDAERLAHLPPGLAALYGETNGVQLAWADRQDPAFDPAAERWEDAPAPWDAARETSGWTGAIWLPPLELRTRWLELSGDRIELDGFVAILADGRRVTPEEALEHLMRWWGSLRHRGERLAHGCERVAFERVLPSSPPPTIALAVSVIEVRRSAAEDAVWSWVDRGLDADQITAAWAAPGATAEEIAAPEEIVEVELEIAELLPSLRPAACTRGFVGQLLGPWGRPKRFTAAVDFSERPRWTIAFPAVTEGFDASDDTTAEVTDDTEMKPNLDAPVAVLPTGDRAETHSGGLQYAVSIRHPGVEWFPRVLPPPVALAPWWSNRVFRGGKVHGLAAAPDGSRVAAISESGELRLWRAEDGGDVALEKQREAESFSDVGFAPDGRVAIWDGNLVTSWYADGKAAGFIHQPMSGVEGFDADGYREFALFATRPVLIDTRGDHHGTIDSVDDDPVARAAVSTNGLEMALGTEGGKVALMDLAPLGRRWVVSTDLGEIRSLAVAPGLLVAVGGREAIAILDANGEELRRMPAHDGEVVSVAWAAGGEFLVSAGLDRYLRVWSARSGALVIERALPQPPAGIAVPPEGMWVAVALPNRVAVFGLSTG
jgi:hypothetical protein